MTFDTGKAALKKLRKEMSPGPRAKNLTGGWDIGSIIGSILGGGVGGGVLMAIIGMIKSALAKK